MPGNFAPLTREKGDVRSLQIADPGGGTNALLALPAGEVWRVLSIRFTLTKTGGGVIRSNVAHITVLGSTVWSTAQVVVQPTAAVNYTFAIGLEPAPAIANLRFSWPLPDSYIGVGGTVGTTGKIGVGATYTNIWIQYLRWRV